jgi:hypothetical protein
VLASGGKMTAQMTMIAKNTALTAHRTVTPGRLIALMDGTPTRIGGKGTVADVQV